MPSCLGIRATGSHPTIFPATLAADSSSNILIVDTCHFATTFVGRGSWTYHMRHLQCSGVCTNRPRVGERTCYVSKVRTSWTSQIAHSHFGAASHIPLSHDERLPWRTRAHLHPVPPFSSLGGSAVSGRPLPRHPRRRGGRASFQVLRAPA